MIQRDRTEQIDSMINPARDQQGGIDIAGIDHVGLRQQSTRGESVLNRCRHCPVRRSRRSGLDIRDQVRPIRLAGLGHMNLVADPAGIALFGVAGVGIIGRVKALVDRRLVNWATPAHLALIVIELLDPDDPQPLDRRQPAQPEPLPFGEEGGQQVMAIGANRLAQSLAGSLAFGQTVLLDPGAIALRPVRPVVLDQPPR
jgi:hypothetical protein